MKEIFMINAMSGSSGHSDSSGDGVVFIGFILMGALLTMGTALIFEAIFWMLRVWVERVFGFPESVCKKIASVTYDLSCILALLCFIVGIVIRFFLSHPADNIATASFMCVCFICAGIGFVTDGRRV